MIRHAFFCCCVVLFAFPAFAQETKNLDTLDLDLKRLNKWGTKDYTYEASHPGNTEKTITGHIILKTEVTEEGIILDDSMKITSDGKERSQGLTHQCQKDNFLTPKRIESKSKGDDEGGTFVAIVDGGKATVRSAGKEREKELPPGVVCMSAFYRLVTLLPRQKGLRITFPYWLESGELNLKKDFVVECLGEETLPWGQKKISCTKFRLTSSVTRPILYWVSDDDALRQVLIDERKLMRLQEDEPKLVQIEAKDKDGADFAMQATETERGDKTSTIKMIRKKRLGSVGSSMFVVQAFYEIAKARKCEYFVNLKEWDDKDGNRIYIGGFTNKKDADLKREFGDQFDYKNEFGQEQKLLSVSQFAPLFEHMREAAKPSADSKSVQPKESQPKQ